MKVRDISFFCVFCLMVSCQPFNRISTLPVTKITADAKPGLYYALPLTTIQVQVETEQTVFVPGPYAFYAAKYLGIQDVIQESYERWRITGVHFDFLTEADPAGWYLLQWKGHATLPPVYSHLLKKGYIMDPSGMSSIPVFYNKRDFPLPQPVYPEVAFTEFFVEKTDTLYKTIFQDSVFLKIPIFRKYTSQTTPEEKAEEAASLILKARKRKFELASADYDVLPQGEALEISLRELDRFEAVYLSLFTGKTFTRRHQMTFYFTPAANQSLESILGRFSESNGWVEDKIRDAYPLRLILSPREIPQIQAIKDTSDVKKSPSRGIFYRMPVPCDIQVFLGPDEIARTRKEISQLGPVLKVAANR